MANPLDFVQTYMPLAQAAGQRLGVSPDILLGQWGLETGWGKSVIPGTNNLGNIKDFSGGGVAATDNMTGSVDKYRAFDTPDAFANHYASLIERKYPGAVGAGSDPVAYANALKAGGYAEDPNYVSKMAAVTDTVRKQPGMMERLTNFLIPAAQAGELPQGKNPFDQFDGPAMVESSDGKGDSVRWMGESANGNPFDQFDAAPEPAFDPKKAVNESLKLFPDSPDPVQHSKALGAGLVQGVTDPFLGAEHWLGKGLDLVGADETGSSLVKNAASNRKAVEDWADPYKSVAPYSGGVGRLGGQLAATFNLPAKLAKGVMSVAPAAGKMAPTVARVAESIGSGGLRIGAPTGSLAGDLALRSLGGGISGGVTAGLVSPDSAGEGALIGAISPLTMTGAHSLSKALGKSHAERAVAQARNAPKLDTIREATAAGYVIPPTSVNPSLTNKTLESISGKIATAQAASVRNQQVTDSLARKALGLPDDFQLTADALSQYRKEAFEAGYEPLKKIGQVNVDQQFKDALDGIIKRFTGKGTIPAMERPEIAQLVDSYRLPGFDSGDAVEAISQLRLNAGSAFARGENELAHATRAVANAIEGQLERAAANISPDLLEAFRQSRMNIAKSHTVEKALRQGAGSIDASKIASQIKKVPLSEELDLIARFANAFPKANQASAQVAGPGVSKLAAAAAPIFAGGGAVVGGPVGAAIAGAVPFVVPPAARAGLLSGVYQRGLGKATTVQPSRLGGLLGNRDIQSLLNRTLPLLGNQ